MVKYEGEDVGAAIGLFEALLKKSWEITAKTVASAFNKGRGEPIKRIFFNWLHI